MTGYELFIDTESTGLNVMRNDRVFGVSYALGDGPVSYIDTRIDSIEDFVRKIDEAKVIVAHGMKFDAHALRTIGVDISGRNLDCTLVRAQLIDEHKYTYDLDSLTGMKVSIIDDLATMFGGKATKNVQMQNLHKAPKDFVARYAIGDIEAMRMLYRQQEGNLPPVHGLEKEVLKVLIKMERKGMRVDMARAEKAIIDVTNLIDRVQGELDRAAGRKINVNSNTQMADLMVATELRDGRTVLKRIGSPKFIINKKGEQIDVGSKYVLIDGSYADCSTKTGAPSIDAEVLQEMTHPYAELVLKVRKYRKILDTFLQSQLMGHQINGRVHPWFNQTRVVTGRLSCNDPNLQAVPKRDPEMKTILRPLFLPDQGRTLLKCEYDQSDVRGFAHYISESAGKNGHPVLDAYSKDPDTDFHTYVSELLGIPRNPGPGGGANAKQINLAMIFNMGPGRLAKQMHMPYEEEHNERSGKIYFKPGPEAEEVFNTYHTKIPGAADMGKRAGSVASNRGYVISIAGRHLRFPDKRFSYKASGYLYQSFTADLIKAAMVETSHIVVPHVQIHDELLFSIDHPEQAWAIQKAMEKGILKWIDTKIPIRTQPEVGKNWGETRKLKMGEEL